MCGRAGRLASFTSVSRKTAAKNSFGPSKKVASAIGLVYIGPSTERSLRLSVRTPGFQPGKRGSIPLGSATFTTANANSVDSVIKAA